MPQGPIITSHRFAAPRWHRERLAIQRWQPGINPIINPRAFSVSMESKPGLDLFVREKFESDHVAADPRLRKKSLQSVKTRTEWTAHERERARPLTRCNGSPAIVPATPRSLGHQDLNFRKSPGRCLKRPGYFFSGYFLTANTQTTPPCGTLFSTPILFMVANASWMRWASTPHPDCTAIYSVPSTS
jgi:hypothetical protein